eukprot:scaffold72949_cov35-Tisochrysis_lutea.AAC.2
MPNGPGRSLVASVLRVSARYVNCSVQKPSRYPSRCASPYPVPKFFVAITRHKSPGRSALPCCSLLFRAVLARHLSSFIHRVQAHFHHGSASHALNSRAHVKR